MDKSKKLTLWHFFFSYLFRRKHIYILGFVFLIITSVSQTSQPRLVGYAIDQLNSIKAPDFFICTTHLKSFYLIIGTYFLFQLTLIIGRWGWRRLLARETHYAGNFLRKMIWDKVQYFKQKELNSKFTPGVLMSLSSSDAFAARFLYGFILVGTFDLSLILFFSIFGMIQIDLEITFYTLALMPVIGVLSWRLSELEVAAYISSKEELSSFNDKVSQVISSIKLQRLSESRFFWEKLLYEKASLFRSKKLNAILITLYYFPLMGLAILVSYIFLFYFGITKVQDGIISIGDFVGLEGYILLLQYPILELGYIISEWQNAKASLQRLIDLYNNDIDEYLLNDTVFDIVNDKAIFQIENLSFSFCDSEHPTIKSLNLIVNSNDRLGIKGQIGSGKTTLLKIMAGLEMNYSGSILFKGIELKHFSRKQLADNIVYVSQENFLFADTIRSNIVLDHELTDEHIWHYLKLSCVDEDIKKLEFGLDTELGEWGVNLSGGQKQRLCLARGLVRRPSVLLLDDCLSAVDIHTEVVILENLERELKNVTVVWVAHRDTTLQKCHKVIKLDEG
jgi:ATP-binding cassette subfamily B protein